MMKNFQWIRTLRTSSSERFLARHDEADVAAVDLHYLQGMSVAGTVILFKDAGLTEADIGALLSSLDDDMLPDVNLAEGNLTYTVVVGQVLGNWEADAPPTR